MVGEPWRGYCTHRTRGRTVVTSHQHATADRPGWECSVQCAGDLHKLWCASATRCVCVCVCLCLCPCVRPSLPLSLLLSWWLAGWCGRTDAVFVRPAAKIIPAHNDDILRFFGQYAPQWVSERLR
jgi:hypothetical protein